jgi:hypothetical protein
MLLIAQVLDYVIVRALKQRGFNWRLSAHTKNTAVGHKRRVDDTIYDDKNT